MERLKGMLYGAFIGDAYALNTHWIYDTEKLKIEANHQESYVDPSKNIFHTGKRKGDFTHYGDQSLLLLKSIATNDGFDIEVFKTHWLTYMNKYEGYIDHASKESLSTLDSATNLGSSSDELGGFSRVAPLIYYHFDDPTLMKYVVAQTRLTHNNDQLIDYSRFITELILELVIGKPLMSSIELLIDKYPHVKQHYEMLMTKMNDDTTETVKDIGQSCSSTSAFPAAIYLLIKYQDNFQHAMQSNILCGGDSAGRGMVIGMVLGAYLGFHALPSVLVNELREKEIIYSFSQHKVL